MTLYDLFDYLDGNIECDIYDFWEEATIYHGDVYGAIKFFSGKSDDWRLCNVIEVDPRNGVMYIPVESKTKTY